MEKMNLEVTLSLLRIRLVFILIIGGHVVLGQLDYVTGTLTDDSGYDAIQAYDIDKYQTNIPNTYSIKSFLPKIGNQAKLPHDVGWSIAHAVTISENARRLDGTEGVNKSPFFVNMLFADEKDVCQEGLSLVEAAEAMKVYGLPAIHEYAYPCPRRMDARAMDKAKDYQIHLFDKVFDRLQSNAAKVNRIKRRLVLDHPVIIAMHTPPSFVTANDFWQPKEIYNEEFPLHSMVVTGYDDELYGGVLEVVNSWGKDWGNQGFMYIRYQDLDFIRYGFAVANSLDLKGNYSIFNGELSLRLASNDSTLEIIRFSHRGYFQLNVPQDHLEFIIKGKANKPFYLKMYYRSGDEIVRMYPTDDWRSSLFQYSFNDIELPGDDLTYNITEDVFSAIYCFMSFDDIDQVDFSGLVKSSLTIGELTQTDFYKPSKLMIWDQNNAQFSGRMADGEVLPLLIDLSFSQ